jgi:hypothetical protein
MITISKKLLVLILTAALAASGGAVYTARYIAAVREATAIEAARQQAIRDEDEAIRRAIGTWYPQSPGKSY